MSAPLVVVTGASSGIGHAAAQAFAAAGHPVLGISLDGGDAGDGVTSAAADVRDHAALQEAIGGATSEHGAVDCLVNSAGTFDMSEFHASPPDRYRRDVETNLIGAMNAARIVIGPMLDAGAGTILNVSSVSDREPGPAAMGYTASKYGLRAFGESLRLAYGKRGLRAINLAPGYVKTPLHEQMGISFEEYTEMLGDPDFMSAEQLAEVILWCYRLPAELTVRDLEIAPTRTTF
jgi:NADP-dependent 3-hydroxy acid dehydrogenase YdfG